MKKVLSVILTAAMVLSLTPIGTMDVFAEDVNVQVNVLPGEERVIDGDLSIVNDYNAAYVLADSESASLKVNGNVSMIINVSNNLGGYAVKVQSNKADKTASVDISGDIIAKGAGASYGAFLSGYYSKTDLKVGGDMLVNGIYSAYGLFGNNDYGSAEIGGSISAKAKRSYGIKMIGAGGKYVIKKDVIADSAKYDTNGKVTDPGFLSYGIQNSDMDCNTSIDINGGIFATGAEAIGAYLANNSYYDDGDLDVHVGEGGITVKALKRNDELKNENCGICMINSYDGNNSIDVKGDVKLSLADTAASGVGVYFKKPEYGGSKDNVSNNAYIHGSLISDDIGICTEGGHKDIVTNIIVENTIEAKKTAIVFKPSDDANTEFNITAWKIIPNEKGIIAECKPASGENVSATELEQSINYIIKTEQPSAGGTFTVVKADGTVLNKVEDLEVAHEGEKVYIKPEITEGYILKAAYNGTGDDKVELSKDNGGYYIVVPKGGGVTLSVDVEEEPKPTPTPEPSATPNATPTPDGNGGQDKDKADDITKEIPFAENIPVEEKQTVIENANTDAGDIEGSTMRYLALKAAKVKKNSIKLTWKKVKGADGYIIYGNKCGKKMKYITTIKNGDAKSYTAKKLKKGKYYKYMVVAYKTTASGDKVITTSKSVHAATDGGKKGNPTSIKVKKTKVSIKTGKTKKIKASYKSKKKVATHIAKFRYESLDESIATVDKKGKIKGVGKGTTKILVYTQNGLSKTIKVTVK